MSGRYEDQIQFLMNFLPQNMRVKCEIRVGVGGIGVLDMQYPINASKLTSTMTVKIKPLLDLLNLYLCLRV